MNAIKQSLLAARQKALYLEAHFPDGIVEIVLAYDNFDSLKAKICPSIRRDESVVFINPKHAEQCGYHRGDTVSVVKAGGLYPLACALLVKEMGEDEILLSGSTAEGLGVKTGDIVWMTSFEAEYAKKVQISPYPGCEVESRAILFDRFLKPFFLEAYRPVTIGQSITFTSSGQSVECEVLMLDPPTGAAIVAPDTVLRCEGEHAVRQPCARVWLEPCSQELWQSHLAKYFSTQRGVKLGTTFKCHGSIVSADGGAAPSLTENKLFTVVGIDPPGKESVVTDKTLIHVCSTRHTLALTIIAQGTNFDCDKCGSHMPHGARSYGCRMCNFDLCRRCFGGGGYALDSSDVDVVLDGEVEEKGGGSANPASSLTLSLSRSQLLNLNLPSLLDICEEVGVTSAGLDANKEGLVAKEDLVDQLLGLRITPLPS